MSYEFSYKELKFNANWALSMTKAISEATNAQDYEKIVELLNKVKISGPDITVDNWGDMDFLLMMKAKEAYLQSFLGQK